MTVISTQGEKKKMLYPKKKGKEIQGARKGQLEGGLPEGRGGRNT